VSDLRLARGTDLDPLSSLERAVFALDAWSPRSIEDELAAHTPNRQVLVAADGSDVIGYAVLSCVGDTGDLRRIAVAEDYRRQGIAVRLLAGVTAAARDRGCERILLEVAADNLPAIALYRRQGFAEVARRDRYYENGSAAVVMELHLDGNRDG
jgi:[ribosomal protein S18]-alanine N-acetyltransferase